MLCMMNLLSSHEGEISLREIDCFAAFSTIVISFFYTCRENWTEVQHVIISIQVIQVYLTEFYF